MAYISGIGLGKQVAEALGLKGTRRIILDIALDNAVIAYVEMLGTDKLLSVDYEGYEYRITEVENDSQVDTNVWTDCSVVRSQADDMPDQAAETENG